jgi:hypothetical protein
MCKLSLAIHLTENGTFFKKISQKDIPFHFHIFLPFSLLQVEWFVVFPDCLTTGPAPEFAYLPGVEMEIQGCKQ